MAFWWMFSKRFLMLDFGIDFDFVSFSMECSCMAPLTPAVMIMMGLVANHYFGWCYLVSHIWCVFMWWLVWESIMTVCEFIELYYVVRWWRYRQCYMNWAPIMHKMSGLSWAWQWHGFWWHVYWSSQSSIVCSCGRLLRWHALASHGKEPCVFIGLLCLSNKV